jgi:hypothetical protein
VRRLLNKYEEVTYSKLKKICDENDAHVFAKVRVADAIPITNSGIPDKEFSFALKSHFDFLMTDNNYNPIFAVEFDGPYHSNKVQKRRDVMKNELCDRFRLPLLRINANYLNREYRGFDLLTYFVEVWFLNVAFEEAQENGQIPWDEGFDPNLIISDGKSSKKWPYWLSADIQVAIQRIHKQGIVKDPLISHWVGVDKEGNYRCLCWFKMREDCFVFVVTGMRVQQFPVLESDLIWQLAAFEIYDKLSDILKGKDEPDSEETFMRVWRLFKHSYQMRSFGGCADFQ